jgi:hypothetical protein
MQDVLLMRAMCGEENFASLAIVTTGWSRRTSDELSGRSKLIEERFRTHEIFGQVIKSGAKLIRFYRDRASAMHIVDTLLARGNKFKLQIQCEVLDKGCNLAETSEGRIFIKYLTERRAELETGLQEAQETLRIALEEGDNNLIKALQQKDEYDRMSIAQLDREMDRISRARLRDELEEDMRKEKERELQREREIRMLEVD